jgi:hypothetical protein
MTTKEILKRYGAVGTIPAPATNKIGSETPPPRSKEGVNPAPVFTRVDTDPYQARAWQTESSVRPVPGSHGQNGSVSHHGTPMQSNEFMGPSVPFRERNGSFGSQESLSQQHRASQYRNPAWGNNRSQPGTPGLTGH